MMSGITVKKSNSFKEVPLSRTTNNSSSKFMGVDSHKVNNDNLRLLNYQYKKEILDKLNRNTRK